VLLKESLMVVLATIGNAVNGTTSVTIGDFQSSAAVSSLIT
jgi:hypothetical protein